MRFTGEVYRVADAGDETPVGYMTLIEVRHLLETLEDGDELHLQAHQEDPREVR